MKEFFEKYDSLIFSIFWFVLGVSFMFTGSPAAGIACFIMGELMRLRDSVNNGINHKVVIEDNTEEKQQ